MNNEFVTFQKYHDLESLNSIAHNLKEQNKAYEIEDASPTFDVSFSYNEISKEYRLKLKQEDFERANKLLEQTAQLQMNSVTSDYYLFEFSDEELIEIITKPDEWGKFDYQLPQKLLKDRGKEITPEIAQLLKNQRIKELAKPEENHAMWVNAGYLFALLGGFIGIFIGLTIATHKKTLPNGERVYAYREEDRKQGWIIFFVGTITFTISPFLRFLSWNY